MANPNTAVYPTGIAGDNDLKVITDNAFSPLAAGIDGVVTSIPFTTNSVFTLPCLIALENEVVLAKGPIVGINITNCQRGYIGVAAPHAINIVGSAYIFANNINQITAEIKAIETALGTGLGNVIHTGSSVGGDLSGTLPNPTVATVGGALAADIATATGERHAQNTDTGTSSATFQIGVGGVKVKNTGVALQARNAADSAYTNFDAQDITTHGTLSASVGGDLSGSLPNPTLAASGVSANTYGDGSHIPQIVVDAKGRITSATTVSVSGGTAPGGSAGGDLTGSYPNPTLAISGVSASTYGDSSHVPVFAVDAKGRITSVTNTVISAGTSGSAGGDLSGTYPNPTVAQVGGALASDIALATAAANAAASSNTPSTIVARDVNGDFAARNVTAKLLGGGGVPTKATGSGAGTGAGSTISGSDTAGLISVTTGTAPGTSSTVITVSFSLALPGAPSAVILTPANAVTASLTTNNVFVTSLIAGGFSISSNAVALTTATTYAWYYMVVG